MALNNKQVSQIIAGCLFFSCFTFLAGYFLGKKHVIENFTDAMEEYTFADKFAYSLASLYENSDATGDTSDTGDEKSTSQDSESESSSIDNAGTDIAGDELLAEQPGTAGKENFYYAKLSGFGSKKAAQNYVSLLKMKGTSVRLLEKKSVTAKGKIITWYQVVTENYKNKNELVDLVNKISNISKLTDVKICDCIN